MTGALSLCSLHLQLPDFAFTDAADVLQKTPRQLLIQAQSEVGTLIHLRRTFELDGVLELGKRLDLSGRAGKIKGNGL